MEILNGYPVLREVYLFEPRRLSKVSTYTDNHTVLLTQSGHTLVMNSTSNKTFTLPSVAAGDIGTEYTFKNINTGRLTIDAADSDTIDDSAAGATIYSDDDSHPTLTIRLASATAWKIVSGNGTWVTT